MSKAKSNMLRKVFNFYLTSLNETDVNKLSVFQKRGGRLKEYLGIYHDFIQKPYWRISSREVRSVREIFTQKVPDGEFDKQALLFAGRLIESFLDGSKVVPEFEGLSLKCVCGDGSWKLSKPISDEPRSWSYKCTSCTRSGRADISGLPVSFPATSQIMAERVKLHQKADKLCKTYDLTTQSLYQAISFIQGVALGYVHIGYITSFEDVGSYMNSLNQIEKDLKEAR
ncbi:hypothetical protein [Vibrio barjaei]|uniref:hypothetical protein n=1 Tax=Vibrio barjaei TaxID=1676683 RepID=UPI002284D169|nr:hypothetical protein [Vibrio barjaei]MCY9872289.1 hypothetical protein [Vibrio barjaei]